MVLIGKTWGPRADFDRQNFQKEQSRPCLSSKHKDAIRSHHLSHCEFHVKLTCLIVQPERLTCCTVRGRFLRTLVTRAGFLHRRKWNSLTWLMLLQAELILDQVPAEILSSGCRVTSTHLSRAKKNSFGTKMFESVTQKSCPEKVKREQVKTVAVVLRVIHHMKGGVFCNYGQLFGDRENFR